MLLIFVSFWFVADVDIEGWIWWIWPRYRAQEVLLKFTVFVFGTVFRYLYGIWRLVCGRSLFFCMSFLWCFSCLLDIFLISRYMWFVCVRFVVWIGVVAHLCLLQQQLCYCASEDRQMLHWCLFKLLKIFDANGVFFFYRIQMSVFAKENCFFISLQDV